MKFEKLNDSQVRCTLSKEDLATRELRLSELAYGSDKARELFHDMIQQASYECGFEAEDLPLMIEAIPISGDSLVLLITKVEDPDELDTRFSNFTPYDDKYDVDYEPVEESFADEILSCLQHIGDIIGNKDYAEKFLGISTTELKSGEAKENDPNSLPGNFIKVYSFSSLENVIRASRILGSFYKGNTTLYKESPGMYYLVMTINDTTAETFNKVCNIVSEYGTSVHISMGTVSYYNEHYECLIRDEAVTRLSKL